jgi:N-ethylmaleimide reductase
MHDSTAVATYSRAASLLEDLKIAYLHVVEALPGHRMAGEGERVTPHIRAAFSRTLIANGGYNAELANTALQAGEADAFSFGMPFLANPDLVQRFRHQYPLNEVNLQTLYLRDAVGYLDYPFHQETAAAGV